MRSIECTVGILTKNSARTLRSALESVREFSEIIVCDGGSTDETIAIAREFGARIIEQDARYLDREGRIANYAGVRNQTLSIATKAWFLQLDSDEYLSSQLVEEVRSAVDGTPGAYWIPRKYLYGGAPVDHSVTYPNQQMRFFHRTVGTTYIKSVHERIDLVPGTVPRTLFAPMYVPLPETARELMLKWRRYLAIEKIRHAKLSLRRCIRMVSREIAIAGLYAIRLVRINTIRHGRRLPISFELARMWYQFALVGVLFSCVRRF